MTLASYDYINYPSYQSLPEVSVFHLLYNYSPYIYLHRTQALSDCDGGGRTGSPVAKEAVRSSSLMGGLCKRTDSKMLGSASPAL